MNISKSSVLTGSKAEIFIKYDGKLESLADKLSQDLGIPKFHYKSDTNLPHVITAMCECLGFETWLDASNKNEGFDYCFKFYSMLRGVEPTNEQMNDVSDWFAKIVAISTSLETSTARLN